MNEINVRNVAIEMGVSPQSIYKRLDGIEATPANIALVLRTAGHTLIKNSDINRARAVKYFQMVHYIEDRIQESTS